MSKISFVFWGASAACIKHTVVPNFVLRILVLDVYSWTLYCELDRFYTESSICSREINMSAVSRPPRIP